MFGITEHGKNYCIKNHMFVVPKGGKDAARTLQQ